MIKAVYLAIAAASLSFTAQAALAQSTGSICISGDFLSSGETRTIEIFDVNAGKSLGEFTMTGGQKTWGISPEVNSSGYINIRYRNVSNNGSWISSSQMKDGDCIKP